MKRGVVLALLIGAAFHAFSKPATIDGIQRVVPTVMKWQQVPVIDIFRAMDARILQIRDEKKMSDYLRRQNSEILKRIALNYPHLDSLGVVDVNDPAATWFGLIFALYEANGFVSFGAATVDLTTAKVPEWLSCTLSVIGTSLGITELINGLGTFTVGSAWKVAKFVVRKYVTGWIGTAVALYQVATQCF